VSRKPTTIRVPDRLAARLSTAANALGLPLITLNDIICHTITASLGDIIPRKQFNLGRLEPRVRSPKATVVHTGINVSQYAYEQVQEWAKCLRRPAPMLFRHAADEYISRALPTRTDGGMRKLTRFQMPSAIQSAIREWDRDKYKIEEVTR